MAGVKGKSGGSRPNAGGARVGAGRKPKSSAKSANGEISKSANGGTSSVTIEMETQPHGGALKRSKAEPAAISDRDMLQLLKDIALGRVDASNTQVRAAIAAVQYTHAKKAEGSKREEDEEKAQDAAGGEFGLRRGPPGSRALN